ncbi:TonB-dependent receptor plug domain-containing protein [bacterium]|nr:TonB-dependent receptor plug domain-containing protein [bacterium]
MMKKVLVMSWLTLSVLNLFAQSGTISGRVYNAINNEPLPFANVGIEGTAYGATTDIEGNYTIANVPPGLYNVAASYLGYEPKKEYEVKVSGNKTTEIDFALTESSQKLEEVVVTTKTFEKPVEAPVSLRSIGVNEIERNPGGNRDISRVIQTLPGVTPTVSFRNDLIIRGGAPNENRFYLDDIEIPTINHFSTQGASGGPVGMINVNFIREVDFYSGAFPANRGNALSSVMDFKLKTGDKQSHNFQATVGASDFGVMFDGPISPKATYMVSYRRSYLQFLFKQIGLPFLPIYNDLQFKIKYEPTQKDHITILGIGAIDNFELNLDANQTREQQYILNYLPVNEQWNYTRGIKYTRFHKNSYTNVVFSRSKLNNTSTKYMNNDASTESNKILDYLSQEVEHKLRIENYMRYNDWKINYGAGAENQLYTNSTYNKIATSAGLFERSFNSKLSFNKYALFGNISRKFVNERLALSFGMRMDAADYNKQMLNLLKQFSPRFSASYAISSQFAVNFNTGRYFQLPPNTVMGYRNNENELVNQNRLGYIQCDHLVGGIEWNTKSNSRITLEGFYKKYSNYPFLLSDSVALANLGSDFGVIGNEPAKSLSKGRSYGVEFLFQQKLYKGFYGILSCTVLWSQFQDKYGQYIASAWDSRNIISMTAGKKIGKNWELGARWWWVTGAPYTPYDIEYSTRPEVWNITRRGLPDYSKLNSQRVSNYNQLDVRLDKKFFFDKFNLNLYFDVQNVFASKLASRPNLDVDTDAQGNPILAANGHYQYSLLTNNIGNTLPTLGIILQI